MSEQRVVIFLSQQNNLCEIQFHLFNIIVSTFKSIIIQHTLNNLNMLHYTDLQVVDISQFYYLSFIKINFHKIFFFYLKNFILENEK